MLTFARKSCSENVYWMNVACDDGYSFGMGGESYSVSSAERGDLGCGAGRLDAKNVLMYNLVRAVVAELADALA